jgi:hypothetical protein
MNMKVNWIKCQGDVWCKLASVNLGHEHFNDRIGVYIIWHGGTAPAVVYVGQGNIRDRLTAHRSNPDIQQYESLGLYVTWATISQSYLDGVEAHLANKWRPKVGSNYPTANPIEVNSPW